MLIELLSSLFTLRAMFDEQYITCCQMTCAEYDVDKLRTDFWDWRFLRFQFCYLDNVPKCTNPGWFKDLMFVSDQSPDSLIPFEFLADHEDFKTLIEKWKNETDFFVKPQLIRLHLVNKTIYIEGKNLEKIETFYAVENDSVFLFDYRRVRFRYNNLFDFELPSNRKHQDFLSAEIYIASESALSDSQELKNFWILSMIRVLTKAQISFLNVSLDIMPNVSIGTGVFDQRKVILTEGFRYLSYLSTIVNIWSLLLILCLTWKFRVSLHGFKEEVLIPQAHCSGNQQKRHIIFRPDLIPVGTEDLNLFRSFFYSSLVKLSLQEVVFYVVSIVCLVLIISYNELWHGFLTFDNNICTLIFIIFIILSLCNIPLFVLFFSTFLVNLYFFLLLKLNTDTSVTNYIVAVYLISCCYIPRLWYYKDKLLLNLRFNSVHLVWMTWPVQLLVYLTESFKRFCHLSVTYLRMIWFAEFCVLFYLGIYVPEIVDKIFVKTTNVDLKYFIVLNYLLFSPVYFICSTFCISYKKIISLVIEAVPTAFSIAFFCTFFLSWVYPSLKSLSGKKLFLYAILALHLVTHLLKIYREWYDKYDKFLKDVVSYVRNKYQCKENKAEFESDENGTHISHVYIHIGLCNDHADKQGHVHDNIYEIKGLLMLIKNSNKYVPSNFFFEVIKIPGAPGAIKSVIAKELYTLVFLRLFPAVLIYWLCHVIYLVDFDNYNIVITAILGSSFVNQYKKILMYRKPSVFDVSGNIALQREIKIFFRSFKSCFPVEQSETEA